MAIGWVSLLKTVPWSDVIASAPAVADGAKRLWTAVAKKNPAAAPTPATTSVSLQDPPSQLAERLAAAEAGLAELHTQMVASSELIASLAKQNAELVRRVEAHRARLRWLSVVAVAAALLAAWQAYAR